MTQKKADPLRRKMVQEIRQNPSISTRALGRAMGMVPSHAKWHLNVLEEAGTIVRVACPTCTHEMWEVRT